MKPRFEFTKAENGDWMIRLFEGDHPRHLVSGSGKTPQEAAEWCLHHLDRITEAVENYFVTMGVLTQDAVDGRDEE